MGIIRPRINDYHNILFTQEEVDFAIPYLNEDIPLYVDPFLLWKSPSLQDNSLHTASINSFNNLGFLLNKGKENEAIEILIQTSECNEVGLGNSKTRIGKPIGKKTALEILSLFKSIPQVNQSGFIHFESIQLFVDGISRDRISDFTCSFIKSFLVDYTIEQCEKYGIPIQKVILDSVYDYRKNKIVSEQTHLPVNPENNDPILFIPKRWIRAIPWINFDDYYSNFYVKEIDESGEKDRIPLLNYNRHNYDVIETYLKIKEQQQANCKNDPIFKPISKTSVSKKTSTILKLPTGKTDNADMKFEDNVCSMLATVFYPQLDFAQEQSRTISGVSIRDLIFYNNKSYNFLEEIFQKYDCRQIVFELKNVKELNNDHVDQLNRYLKDQFGRFGVLVSRNDPPKKVLKNIMDLWAGQRKCILVLTDEDIKMMNTLFRGNQRLPIDVLKKRYVEFTRNCPS
ncbi:hypothetical protein [Cyclobacterium jeungdonense]|uniref:Uncharacterized protein n=1 Tax=Cyclobacterium jeungdonense TaxID=708087 RepID=A0ABT8C4T7_9BACT|nr:hypothetical protein [Cyclobacterium jeungdonense]MDN3686793.1 hypothetical protein [Cyclobacterium jeungdonense]